ncbi:MAG TPA: TraB/GumN family protein [Steroidobacteraceae bacterium]|nr:TraB/GumN family protein [Steroidobacteraceae bacterium]
MRPLLAALCILGGLSLAGPVRALAQSPVWALRGAHNTVYLAESVHLLKPGQAALPPAFDRAYADAGTLVMEMDLGRVDPTQIQAWMLDHGTFKDGTTLAQAVGTARYGKIAPAIAALGLPDAAVQQFKPWVVGMMLTDLEYLKLGYDPQSGVEEQLLRRAMHDGKPTSGLESLDEELGQLDGLPMAVQADFLASALDDLQDAGPDTDDLLAAWRAGDAQHLSELLSKEYRDAPQLYRALVAERNARWMPRIRAMLRQDHNYLVVVGALHVVGAGGLLELARRAGIAVSPVLAPAAPPAGTPGSGSGAVPAPGG